MDNLYETLNEQWEYIDKTEVLEKGISVFPSIYIEGAAASGKTTAVQMLFRKYPDMRKKVYWMGKEVENPDLFVEKIADLRKEVESIPIWIVFEECTLDMPSEIFDCVKELIEYLNGQSGESKVILIGRDRIPDPWLDLLWKAKLELISQRQLNFSQEEVAHLVEKNAHVLDANELYNVTGGWPGCVSLMLRLAEQKEFLSSMELRLHPSIDRYIQHQILDTLSKNEKEILSLAQICPWVNEKICQEMLELEDSRELLIGLLEKGILKKQEEQRGLAIVPLFADIFNKQKENREKSFWEELGTWYEKNGYVREMFSSLRNLQDENIWKVALKKYYKDVPFFEGFFSGLSNIIDIWAWEEDIPEVCYLRGMYALWRDDISRFHSEIKQLEKKLCSSDKKTVEIYLNLRYLDTEISVDEWLALVEKYCHHKENSGKIRIYGKEIPKFSCLSGLRDLSDLFACSKKEERMKSDIWKAYLGEDEWKRYEIARIEYYIETERVDAICQEDENLFRDILKEIEGSDLLENYGLYAYYILLRMKRLKPQEVIIPQIENLEERMRKKMPFYLKSRKDILRLKNAYSEDPICWSKEVKKVDDIKVTELKVTQFFCQSKSYLYLGHYEKALELLQPLVVHLQKRNNIRLLAEVLFMQAIILQHLGQSGKALRSVIESFLLNGTHRYVLFYTDYGVSGREILEQYVDWLKKSKPDGWKRKKKYNYGNVLRMPEEDYLEFLLRKIKHHEGKIPIVVRHDHGEQLTMMEKIILQQIAQGMTNQEICETLNLKLSTVKTHIYNLYKKMGVNSRTQAILKVEEMKKYRE